MAKRSLFCRLQGAIYRRRRLRSRPNFGRFFQAREWVHAPGPTKFQLHLGSIRNNFVSIRNCSNRAETWQDCSLPCVEATVKISLHLDQGFVRYDRYEIKAPYALPGSNPWIRIDDFASIQHVVLQWRSVHPSGRSTIYSESTASPLKLRLTRIRDVARIHRCQLDTKTNGYEIKASRWIRSSLLSFDTN